MTNLPVVWANEFREIPGVLRERADLRSRALTLLIQNSPAKVLEGPNRLDRYRAVMGELIEGRLTIADAYSEMARQLPRHESQYGGDNRVFASGWEERLVRTNLSRFYNQSVLEAILEEGGTTCFVPHSSEEDRTTQCSQLLAGRAHDAATLLHLLVESYTLGRWSKTPKVPDHPHCTHVVRPATV